MTLEVTPETTRNENFVIFETNRQIVPPGTGPIFSNAEAAQRNPLARDLFQINGISSVHFLGSSIQIAKEESARWTRIKSKIMETLKDHLGSES